MKTRSDREPEPRIFTEYIRALDPHGEPPGDEAFGRLWQALRMALRSELKKKGLWESPPAYLGIEDGERWEEPVRRAARQTSAGDALDELTKDCYLFIFDERLRSLKIQLRRKPNVDGLVFLNIRHFLHERQRQYDPIGFRVYQVLHAALERALPRGELRVLSGDPRIRNDTRLGFEEAPGPAPSAPWDPAAWAADVGEALLPDLIEAKGGALNGVLDKLRERLVALGAHGVGTCSFRDLVDPLKGVVRTWAAARLQAEAAPSGAAPRDGSPEVALAASDSYEKLTRCVEERLARRAVDPRTRGYLMTLWRYGRTRADDSGPASADGADEPGTLSDRKLAERLGIPRDRLPELRAHLREMVAQCQAANRSVPPLQGGRDDR